MPRNFCAVCHTTTVHIDGRCELFAVNHISGRALPERVPVLLTRDELTLLELLLTDQDEFPLCQLDPNRAADYASIVAKVEAARDKAVGITN